MTVIVRSQWMAATPLVLCDRRSQVGHADVLGRAFLGRAMRGAVVARSDCVIERPPIDLEDDLQLPRQRISNHATGHFSRASGSSV